jgi:hypothetical protein
MSARICLSPIPSTTSRNGKARTVTTANPANTHASPAFPRISGAAHTRSHDNLSGHIRRVDHNTSLASRGEPIGGFNLEALRQTRRDVPTCDQSAHAHRLDAQDAKSNCLRFGEVAEKAGIDRFVDREVVRGNEIDECNC